MNYRIDKQRILSKRQTIYSKLLKYFVARITYYILRVGQSLDRDEGAKDIY